MRADIEAALDRAEETVPLREAHTLVGLAGSVTTVSAIAQDLPEYDSEAIHHSRVSRDRVREITEWLLRSTHAERAAVPSMHPGRVDAEHLRRFQPVAGGSRVVAVGVGDEGNPGGRKCCGGRGSL